jgi:hypothetical protein
VALRFKLDENIPARALTALHAAGHDVHTAVAEGLAGAHDRAVLVEFNGVATSARYFGLQFYLEDLLSASVDLVTTKALRPQLRPFIERDAIHV